MPETFTMSDFLSTTDGIGAFFTSAVGWVGEVIDTITSNPALLVIVFAMPIVGLKIRESSLNRVNSVKLSFFETIPSQA